jgi:hypothetical protein
MPSPTPISVADLQSTARPPSPTSRLHSTFFFSIDHTLSILSSPMVATRSVFHSLGARPHSSPSLWPCVMTPLSAPSGMPSLALISTSSLLLSPHRIFPLIMSTLLTCPSTLNFFKTARSSSSTNTFPLLSPTTTLPPDSSSPGAAFSYLTYLHANTAPPPSSGTTRAQLRSSHTYLRVA